MVEDTTFIISTIPILSILIGVGTLAGFIYKIGAWINKKAAEKATLLKDVTEKKSEELRKYAESMAKEVKELNEIQITDLKERLNDIHAKLDKITERQDLVNGNVGTIRNEISDVKQDIGFVQEDITELFNDDDYEEDKGRDHDAVSIRRRKDRDRDRKRRTIKSDADWQGKRIHER